MEPDKQIRPLTRSEVIEQVDDGRCRVSWRCQHCGVVNENLGLAPTSGFDCAGCGAAARVQIKHEPT